PKRSVQPGCITSARSCRGSSSVKRLFTEESMARNRPAGVFLQKISAKNRGLTVLSESQQGMRNATGALPRIDDIKSTQRSYVDLAFAKSPPCKRGHG